MRKMRGFEFTKNAPSDLVLPTRKTKYSGAYDFVLPENVTIKANSFSKRIPLYVKSYMQGNECLELYIRSSIAMKKHCFLPTGVSIVDSDYYNCEENEGNIHIVIYNAGNKPQFFKKGERIIQGRFSKYLTVDNDSVTEKRKGGSGSTGA